MFFTPKRVEKPWGYEIWFAHTDQYVGKILHVNEGCQLSLQYHEQKDETIYCLRGNIVIVLEQEGSFVDLSLPVGQSIRIQPYTKHRLRGGEGGGDALEASTSQVEDVVRCADDYGRSGA